MKILIFPLGIGYCSQITSWWAFFMPNNSLGKYTAALSIKIHALRGIFFEFDDGIMAAVFLPIYVKLKETMNTISLTPTTRVAPDVGLANALARKALECVTSMGFNIALGIVAMACALPWLATGEYAAVMVAAVAAWGIHLSVWMTLEIAKGGEEL